ncbi:hypothetical protein AMTR_s00029p00168870 [Amborella trichopoda]|uniref:Plant heme peroxidase family profile domain-containing protein n=1 Tax=Amborella trichopoda TaxID=13333 RepID=W1PPD7_AMBTC|nr:hypothetical protein AMTR_s00029p00168870 [Amborella trichopoda]
MGGPSWTVNLWRRDSATASKDEIGTQCQRHGCSLRCTHHRPSPVLHIQRQNLQPHQHRCRLCRGNCPSTGGDSNLAALDLVTPTSFDNNYFKILMQKKGLLESDQVLLNGGSTDDIVRSYSNSRSAFYSDFAPAMVKMGDIEPLTGSAGQIRARCSVPN